MTQLQHGWWQELQPLVGKHSAQEVFEDFVTIAACALVHPHRESEYSQVISKYASNDLNAGLFPHAFGHLLFERSLNPFSDSLGEVYDELLGERHGKFTSPQLAAAMAVITFGEELERKYAPEDSVLLHDPACGTGAMLLSAVRLLADTRPHNKVVVRASDTDRVLAQITLLNLSLAGVSGEVQFRSQKNADHPEVWFTNTSFRDMLVSMSGLTPLISTLTKGDL